MHMKLIKFLFLSFLTIFLSGCFSISQYHLGYHHYGDGKLYYGVVSKESVAALDSFEDECIRKFVDYKIESLRPLFSPKTNDALSDALLFDLNKKLEEQYGFNGTFQKIKLTHQKTMLDEAAAKDAFEYYDLISARYHLKGSTDAVIEIFMTKYNGELRLSGFTVMDFVENQSGNNQPVKYIFPESTDKARLAGRYYTIIK